jgi:hypothetical protein
VIYGAAGASAAASPRRSREGARVFLAGRIRMSLKAIATEVTAAVTGASHLTTT